MRASRHNIRSTVGRSSQMIYSSKNEILPITCFSLFDAIISLTISIPIYVMLSAFTLFIQLKSPQPASQTDLIAFSLIKSGSLLLIFEVRFRVDPPPDRDSSLFQRLFLYISVNISLLLRDKTVYHDLCLNNQ